MALCGRNERLRQRLASAGRGMALGWQPDMPGLMAAVAALVDNAGWQTCQEAFAAGVPVVTYRPIPGHGRDGARAAAGAGRVTFAEHQRDLVAALDELTVRGARRDRQVAAAAALFTADPIDAIMPRTAQREAQPRGRPGIRLPPQNRAEFRPSCR